MENGNGPDQIDDWDDAHLNRLAPGDECGVGRWHGVATDDIDGQCRVIRLSLDIRKLVGPIPSQIGALGKLQYLNLSKNYLYGPIPSALGNLSDLQVIGLNQNPTDYRNLSLSGELPASFGRLTNLTMMNLSNNPKLTGELPAELGNLHKLEHIKLEDTGFYGCMPPTLVDNFGQPFATDIISPLLAYGAGIAVGSFTAGLGTAAGYGGGFAIGLITEYTGEIFLDPFIKPAALHALPWIGSELGSVSLTCE